MQAMASLSQDVGVQKACVALGVARASFYRWSKPPLEDAPKTEPVIPSWSLSSEERQRVLDLLHTDRFVDQSPREVYATMLDEGTYLCSVRSMYRILEEQGELGRGSGNRNKVFLFGLFGQILFQLGHNCSERLLCTKSLFKLNDCLAYPHRIPT